MEIIGNQWNSMQLTENQIDLIPSVLALRAYLWLSSDIYLFGINLMLILLILEIL